MTIKHPGVESRFEVDSALQRIAYFCLRFALTLLIQELKPLRWQFIVSAEGVSLAETEESKRFIARNPADPFKRRSENAKYKHSLTEIRTTESLDSNDRHRSGFHVEWIRPHQICSNIRMIDFRWKWGIGMFQMWLQMWISYDKNLSVDRLTRGLDSADSHFHNLCI